MSERGMIALNTGFLFKDRPFLERIALAARHGFDAVEFHDEAQRENVDDVAGALREAGLPLLGLNTRMGNTAGCAGVPDEIGRARADIDRAIETARALGARAVHVLAGKTEESGAAWETYRANLQYAADAAPELTILIEPLCTNAMPGYLLSTVTKAASAIGFIDRENVRIMFDVFHVTQAGDPIERTFEAYKGLVGHVQIADPETRHEPDTALLQRVRTMGWAGPIGAEYVPAGAVEDGLGWMA